MVEETEVQPEVEGFVLFPREVGRTKGTLCCPRATVVVIAEAIEGEVVVVVVGKGTIRPIGETQTRIGEDGLKFLHKVFLADVPRSRECPEESPAVSWCEARRAVPAS